MERSEYIGGTDVAAICGESSFATIHDVWLQKMGLADPREPSINMRVGTHMENLIARLYEEKTSLFLTAAPPLSHPTYNFLGGHPDRHIVGPSGFVGINELKNVTFQKHKWGEDGTVNCPTGYQVQATWYAGIKDALGDRSQKVDIGALIGNADMRVYPIGWQPELFDGLLKMAIHFWETYVTPAREAKSRGGDFGMFAPPIDETESASRMLKAIWPSHREIERAATPEIETAIQSLMDIRAEEDSSHSDRVALENKIKRFMEDAAILTFTDGRITYRQSKDTRKVDWEKVAAEERDLYVCPHFEKYVERHTTTKPGVRRFIAPKRKKDSNG